MVNEFERMMHCMPLPVSNHPLFNEKHSAYSKAYNRLSRKLQKAKIDIKELFAFENECKEYERLGYLAAYKIGYEAAEAKYSLQCTTLDCADLKESKVV